MEWRGTEGLPENTVVRQGKEKSRREEDGRERKEEHSLFEGFVKDNSMSTNNSITVS